MKVTLPATFWTDHVDRDLPCGAIVSSNGRSVTVECTPAELSELESDARYYASSGGPDMVDRSITRSAKATIAAIERFRNQPLPAGQPDNAPYDVSEYK